MVTEQRIPSRAELLEALRSSEQEVLAKLGALPAEEFEQGRYESGWNGRQILAHVASIEWTYPRLMDVAKLRAPGGIDAYNQRQVEKRAQASVAELLAEFQQNRAATIAAVEGSDEAFLTTPIRSAGGVTGPLAGVIYAVAVAHVLGHLNDIAGTG